MIQRIQSLWLFLASLPGFLFFFLPIADFSGDMIMFSFYANGLDGSAPIVDPLISQNVYPSIYVWLLMILILSTLVLPFCTIFQYKNRKKQILWARLSVLLNIVLLVAMFLLIDMLSKNTGVGYRFNYFTVFAPIVSIIFLFLGLKGIQKDEKLVKAADRIR